MTTAVTDRIEKKVLLRAPRGRVWRALTDIQEFAAWFGVKFEGPFVPGARIRGTLLGSAVDESVAKAQRQHANVPFEITVDRVEPERVLAFRWHPAAVDPGVDYSAEPTTLIVFTIQDAPDGTMITVTESGFDQIPLDRRAQAFTANDEGWSIMMSLIERYLAERA